MQIFSKAAFSFGPGLKKDGTSERFTTIPNVFQDMPDKFSDDALFKDCVKLGLVQIVSGLKVVEKSVPEPAPVVDEVPSSSDELSEFEATLKGTKKADLIAIAEDAGIHLTGDETVKDLRKVLYEAKASDME